ncbi:MAG: ATP synthase F1 subunit epsilon [Parachlamydiaceae bacterium]
MYHLFLVTPEKVLFDGHVYSVNAPGEVGFFEVLSNHASMISVLKEGKLVVTDQDKQKHAWHISGGYFDVSQNRATVLANSAEASVY